MGNLKLSQDNINNCLTRIQKWKNLEQFNLEEGRKKNNEAKTKEEEQKIIAKKEDEEKKIKKLEGYVWSKLGSLHYNLGNLPKTEEFYKKSLKIRQSLFMQLRPTTIQEVYMTILGN